MRPANKPVTIRQQPGIRPLVQDAGNNILAAVSLAGEGKLILSTIPNTYGWVLEGNRSAYAGYWSILLNTSSRKNKVPEQLIVPDNFPRQFDAVEFILETNSNTVPQIQSAGSRIALAQDPFFSYRWKGRYWPEKQGWQAVVGSRGDLHWWYAYGATDWREAKILQAGKDTRDYAKKMRDQLAGQSRQHFGRQGRHSSVLLHYIVFPCLFFSMGGKKTGLMDL